MNDNIVNKVSIIDIYLIANESKIMRILYFSCAAICGNGSTSRYFRWFH